MFNNSIWNFVLITLVTFVVSAFLMPVMKWVASHIGAIDVPRDDEGNRHIHKKPVPKLGGVGIWLAFLVGYMLFGVQSIQMNSILIGSFLIILTGIVDDIKPLRAREKLVPLPLLLFMEKFY